MRWAYGITTVPSRAKNLLAQTLTSLANAGFDKPVLFVDGMEDGWEPPTLNLGGIVMFHPKIGHVPNWMMALLHLYSTQPQADLYAIFEDDLLATKNLRTYLERCPYPQQGYWNLITHPENLFLTQGVDGWHQSNQRGRGAVGLVFSRHVARTILSSHIFLDRPIVGSPAADGMVIDAIGILGYKEYIHCPTLLQHIGGGQSVMGHKYGEMPGWRGEEFDLSTINSTEEVEMNETLALARMISPNTPRPNVWLGGVIQIHVTRACDMACYGCTQGSNLGGKPVMISPEDFELACQSLAGYWGIVGMFGGNPAIHPQFEKLCEIFAKHFPFEQRGLWCNNPLGKGKIMRETFNPRASNLNVHLSPEAYIEFKRDWPESHPFGLTEDSRHSPPYVAMKDVIEDESKRWELIANCDINKNWSAMVCHVPGKGLRGFFCEIAGAQAMLHAHDPNWPDTGVEATPGWWQQSMLSFAEQVRVHCHSCGVPLRRFGQLATSIDEPEEVSVTHADIYKLKNSRRQVDIVQLDTGKKLDVVTNYVENSQLAGEQI